MDEVRVHLSLLDAYVRRGIKQPAIARITLLERLREQNPSAFTEAVATKFNQLKAAAEALPEPPPAPDPVASTSPDDALDEEDLDEEDLDEEDLDEEDLDDEDDEDEDDEDDDDDEGFGKGGTRIDHTQEKKLQPGYEREKDDKEPEDFETDDPEDCFEPD
jgi:hypothetical protein